MIEIFAEFPCHFFDFAHQLDRISFTCLRTFLFKALNDIHLNRPGPFL